MHGLSIKNDLMPLLKLAIPLALTGMVHSSVSFFETLFLAHVSQDALAAGALVGWLFGTMIVILLGTLSAINILVAHKYGANDHHGISLVTRDGLLLAIFFVIPAFLLFWNMSPIFLLFGQSPTIVALTKTYAQALAWGLLPNFIMVACLEMVIGLGHSRLIMKFAILLVSLNIFCSYVLIFGKFGSPALGIAGAGWGMTISYWITAIALVIYLLTHSEYKKYLQHVLIFEQPSFLFELLKLGIPMGLMFSIEVGFFFALTLCMGFLGPQILAANQIALQYMGALMTVIFSTAQAVTVRMGHLLGAKEILLAARVNNAGILIAAVFMGLVALCYWFIPLPLIAIDFDVNNPSNHAIVYYATQFFAVSALFQICEAIRISMFGALRALQDTRFTLLTSIISFWCIALPIGYFIAIPLELGGVGFWWGMVIGAASSVLLLQWRFKKKIKYYVQA